MKFDLGKKQETGSVSLSKKFIIALILVIGLEFITMIYFGTLKSGFHEDEFYSYFSSNRTQGFYYPDREWVDTNDLLKELTVQPGEGFNYGLVKLVQSWDVHPPLFYYALHTVCSLTPGVFSKWQGLSVNLFFFVIVMILLAAIALKVSGGNENVSLVTVIAYGFSPAAVSMVMFIRMYTMLTAAVLAETLIALCFLKSVRESGSGEKKGKTLRLIILAALVTLAGFLTQYFYLIYLFFLTVALGILLFKENLKEWLGYCAGQALAGVLGILLYPAALSQIFGGYRGKEAQAAFIDLTDLGDRLSTFLTLTNKYLFNSIGVLLLFVIAASFAYSFYMGKSEGDGKTPHAEDMTTAAPGMLGKKVVKKELLSGRDKAVFLLAPSAGYFLVVAKTSLMLGDSSLRYMMPILPLLMLLVVLLLHLALEREKNLKIALTTAAMLLIGIGLYNLAGHQVLFLYEEETAKIEVAKEHKDDEAIVIYNPVTPDNVARLLSELLCFDKVYYVDASDTEEIEEPKIEDSKDVLVYAADSDTTGEVLKRVAECMNQGAGVDALVTADDLFHKDMWTTYIFSKNQ